MKTAIILHGMPSREEYFDATSPAQSNKHWIPWIQRELILNGVLAQTPEMPEPYYPDYNKWREMFERFPINEETILIGHSCGGGFLIRWLSESKIKVGKVALVAPWTDPLEDKEFPNKMFGGFKLDPTFPERTKGVTVFISKERYPDVQLTVDILEKEAKGIDIKFIPNMGHFTMSDMKTEEFPELRDILLA